MYKFIERNFDKVKYLAETNPGVITLFLYTQDLNNDIEHEGEVIKHVRNHLTNRHPEYNLKDYWKSFTKRSHDSIYNHIVACAQQSHTYADSLTTELLITTTINDYELQPSNTSWLDCLNDNRFRQTPFRHEVLSLLLQEAKKYNNNDEWFQGLQRQIMDITDYLRNVNPDTKINSTSWNGLLQRCDEWHRDQRAHANLNQHDPSTKNCWNVLIEKPIEFPDQQVVVTPLSDSIQLYMESDEVQHCVRSYVQACTQGRSRIFKIRPIEGHEDRSKVGTMEIEVNNTGLWQVRQVRGLRNHPMPDSIQSVATKIAEEYTRLWLNNWEDQDQTTRHRAWTEPRDNK